MTLRLRCPNCERIADFEMRSDVATLEATGIATLYAKHKRPPSIFRGLELTCDLVWLYAPRKMPGLVLAAYRKKVGV